MQKKNLQKIIVSEWMSEKNQTTSPQQKIMQPLKKMREWVSEWKNHAKSPHKIHATYQPNATSPHNKIMQPLHQIKIMQAPKKITQSLHHKNHATTKKNHATSPQKIHTTSPHKN